MSQSIFPTRACPMCGANEPSEEISSERRAEEIGLDELRPFWSGLFKEKRFFTYARCASCGQLYAPRFFTNEQLGELYANMAPNMEDISGSALEATQQSYWAAANKRPLPPGGYLEVGPDIGYIARAAARDGDFEHFWLFEPNRGVHDTLCAVLGERPHTICTDMDELVPVPDGSISLAVMVHVLDHLLHPLAMLRQVRSKLRPGGVLMIVTHNERSMLRSIMGVKFPPFCLQHPELYNPTTISRMLKRAGFETVDVQRSKNYFPIAFMVRQAGWTAGIDLSRVRLPTTLVGLKLGNMLTLASVAA